jgi:hypothetical protein
MRAVFSCLLALGMAALGAGCTTQAKARRQAQAAFWAGQHSFMEQRDPSDQHPVVFFRGFFQKQMVDWTEDLTLAEGLYEARFTGAWDPEEIILTRGGQMFRINAHRLMRGLDNPQLEPGDVVEIRR